MRSVVGIVSVRNCSLSSVQWYSTNQLLCCLFVDIQPSGISIHVSVIAVKVMSYVNNPGLSLAFQVGGSRYH